MQMIDVLKRLAELDAKNPNIVKQGVAEGQLDELSPQTLSNYARKAAGQGNWAGSAAKALDRRAADRESEYYRNSNWTDPKVKYSGEAEPYAKFSRQRAAGIDKAVAKGGKHGYDLYPGTYGTPDDPVAKRVARQQGVAEGSAPEIDAQATSQYAQKILDALGKEYGRSYFDYRYNKDDSIEIWTKSTNINPDSVITPYYNLFRDKGWHFSQPVGGKFTIAVEKPKQQTGGLAWRDQVEESLEECGMMGGMSSQPHSPASINMTAATGEELSSMLKDIMTLAGRAGGEMPMGEPMGGANGVAVVDMEPAQEPEMGSDEPSIMRSMMDKLNPSDDSDTEEPADDEEKVDEYDNTPADATAVPGNDQDAMLGREHNRDQSGAPGAAVGRNNMNNPVAMPMEQKLMAEYRKFVTETNDAPPAESANQSSGLVPGQFYVVGNGDQAVAGPFDDEGEAEYEKAEYSQGGKEDAAVAQWTGNGWNFDYMMEQGEEDSSNIESLKSFFNKLRDEVNRGVNVMDTFHTYADRLPFQGKRLRQIMQFLRYQSAEADAAQDNPEEMKSIMLAAINKVENALGIKNEMNYGATSESQDILRLAGLR